MYSYGQHLHFIGIGGVGMAGIAEVLLNLGYSISGSDVKSSALTEHLSLLGARIAVGHRAENIPEKTAVVVVSSAIHTDNIEIKVAEERGIPVIPRAEMLSELMRMKYGIAVAGSHGKTTTTSMTAKILSDIGLDPTVIIGGKLLSQNSGARLGLGQYLVAEADESDGSFNLLRPAIAVVTNIDCEHLVYYGTFGALEAAFGRFMGSVPFYGLVVSCFDDPVVARVTKSIKRRVVSYGLSPKYDYSAKDINICNGVSEYTLLVHGKDEGRVVLPLPGIHMVSNSLAAIAVGTELGAYPEETIQSLNSFPGVGRRSEIIGEVNGVLLIDDYAHHPTEIKATLNAVKGGFLSKASSRDGGKLVVIFQPHRYSRLKDSFAEFLTAFNTADQVIVTDVYAAGEGPIDGINAKALVDAMQHENVSYCSDINATAEILLNELKPNDILLSLGAGDITRVCRNLYSKSNSQ